MGFFLFTKSSAFIKCSELLVGAKSPFFRGALFMLRENVVALYPVHPIEINARLYCSDGHNRRRKEFSRENKKGVLTVRGMPVFPKSVFAAGTAKRTTDYLNKKYGMNFEDEAEDSSKRVEFIELPSNPLTPSEWRKLKEDDPRPDRFEIDRMTRLFKAGADINIAKSLLAYAATENGTLPYQLLLRYLNICVSGGHESEIFDVYDIIRSCFPSLDTGAQSLFIKGFSRTERWRESLTLLENLKKSVTPSPRNYGDAIAASVSHGDAETGWRLYNELLQMGLIPRQETWQLLFESKSTQHSNEHNLLSILSYMRDNQIYPEEPLAYSIKAWFESLPDQQWKGRFSTVDPRAECRSCRTKLESIQLTEEEYVQLKDSVMRDVIEGKDIFNKTTPEEVETFRSFVMRRPAFDVVIDGLNVANITPKRTQSQTLLRVVSELEKQGLSILVLGRKHMLHPSQSWDRNDMKLIRQKAHCFFTENISEDDPFLLYATLHSGNHCKFVSRDLMRDHKACLPDSATRRLFFKWQRGHQLVLDGYAPGKRVQFQTIQPYDTIVQTNGTCWHIPYDEDDGNRCTYEVPQKWLCITKAV